MRTYGLPMSLSPLDRALLPARHALARRRRAFVNEQEIPAAVTVRWWEHGFLGGDVAYNGIGAAPDGSVVFAVGSRSPDSGGRLFALDPATDTVRELADLDAALAAGGPAAIPHGKVHVDLAPIGHELVGATHVGFYDPRSRQERLGQTRGRAPFPGGVFFAVAGERVRLVARGPAGQGIITMAADPARGRLHGLTWPGGHLVEASLAGGAVSDHGPVLGAGETGSRRRGSWTRICRSMGVDPGSGAVFWSDAAGTVMRHLDGAIERVGALPEPEMWRKVAWDPDGECFYGVQWSSATLFRLDAHGACERLGSLRAPGARPGTPATLAFALAPGGVVHALATGPGLLRRGGQLATTTWHLTHDVASGRTEADGPLRLPDGRWVTEAQSLLLAGETAYSVLLAEVPARAADPRSRALRGARRGSAELRSRGYAEEVGLAAFALRR